MYNEMKKILELYGILSRATLIVKIGFASVPVILCLAVAIKSCNTKTTEDLIAEDLTNTGEIINAVENIKDATGKLTPPTLKEVKDSNKEGFNEAVDNDSGVF